MNATHNFTADGTSPSFGTKSRTMFIAATGSFGGGSVTAEISLDDGTEWIPLADSNQNPLSMTENSAVNIKIIPSLVRFILSGAAAPDINIYMAS